MRRRCALVAALLASGVTLAVARADGPGGSPGSPWDALLSANGLEGTKLAPELWREGGPRTLPLFDHVVADGRLLEGSLLAAARRSIASTASLVSLLDAAADLGEVSPRARPAPRAVGARPDPLGPEPFGVWSGASVASVGSPGALVAAIERLERELGLWLGAAARRELAARAASVPPEVARRAILVLEAIPLALERRRAALARFRPELPEARRFALAHARALALGLRGAVDDDTVALMDSWEEAPLLEGARALAAAADAATAPGVPAGAFGFEWTTPIGKIVLAGDGDDRHEGPFLLVLDTGGNDRYRSRSPSPGRPISIVLDLEGDDEYRGGASPAAGVLGYGLLVDVAGNDRHEHRTLGAGTGIFGVGLCLDRAGDDRHTVEAMGQGAAAFGMGVLADLAGNDQYVCFQKAQGYAATQGRGLLLDLAGDDVYTADDERLRYPSPQTVAHNTSLAQGAGFGRRAHPGDGRSLAGGFGLLVDAAGNDRYSCGVFGQGIGYWFGLGGLVDLAGDDAYRGVWYTQGSAAHFAAGGLVDLAGNDRYRGLMHMSQGAANDHSLALFVDAAGDDLYEASGLALGAALWGSIALARDDAGDDRYAVAPSGLGAAEGSPPGHACLGLFRDVRGKDRYEPARSSRPAPDRATCVRGLAEIR